jgi:hypothetical protein
MVRPASLMLGKVIPTRMTESMNLGCVELWIDAVRSL